MDIVTDLTSRAVAYITIVEDLCKARNSAPRHIWDLEPEIDELKKECGAVQKTTICDVIWSSYGDMANEQKINFFFHVAKGLMLWLKANKKLLPEDTPGTPYQWRNVIRAILYKNTSERSVLAEVMHYMPVQIIIYLAGNEILSAYDQRLHQAWKINEDVFGLLSGSDFNDNENWWDTELENGTRRAQPDKLLASDKVLLTALKAANIPVPFETLFNDELDEIKESRKIRRNQTTAELQIDWQKQDAADEEADPLVRATKMELHALAFSGGGIRSATFNLGVLQRLAELEMLPKFDYLSTVSGGGYIGTWFASWIKRGGSVNKVANRLDHFKSADPLAEEVRPIRWLRMFSNYLAPDAGIMSLDAWTMGVTWLRNTLINQVILFLLLLSVLSSISVTRDFWRFLGESFQTSGTFSSILFWSGLVILPGPLLAGVAMQSYHKQHPPQSVFNFGRNPWLPTYLLLWALISALCLCYWFSVGGLPQHWWKITDRFEILMPTVIVGSIGMILVAYLGGYREYDRHILNKKWSDIAIISSSIVATLVGVIVLSLIWELLSYFHTFNFHDFRIGNRHIKHYGDMLVLITGVPLLLEVISCCVVVRMALLGSLFPDERREWWGRMGAMTHRFSFLWLLISASALLLPPVMREFFSGITVPVSLSGWVALVGSAVKMAYKSNESKSSDSNMAKAMDIFVKIAPYLFMVGFLLLGAYTLDFVNGAVTKIDVHFHRGTLLTGFAITVLMWLLTLLLSWRVGVNEFSLHYFYKNRLVRAYMGATRSRANRQKTANPFTQFDSKDDILLREFSTGHGYYGPLPILNTALNSSEDPELDRQDRKAESFVFTPLYCGFDFSLTRSAATADRTYEYGYRPTSHYGYKDGPAIGMAMAISGAAVNPNWGYHSSPATAFLLTLFNVRLGWWMGNTRKSTWTRSNPKLGLTYLVSDLIGSTNIDSSYVCLSDGGHFDNMGLYELIRRRCHLIVLGDGEEDDDSSFEGLANAIRRCRIDFGVDISIKDIDKMIPKDDKNKVVEATILEGEINYPGNAKAGKLIYIKSRITKDLSIDVRQYDMTHTAFPEQSTADQFFTEDQFESYRKLGYNAVKLKIENNEIKVS